MGASPLTIAGQSTHRTRFSVSNLGKVPENCDGGSAGRLSGHTGHASAGGGMRARRRARIRRGAGWMLRYYLGVVRSALSFPEIEHNIPATLGVSAILPTVPLKAAEWLAYSAETITAEEALACISHTGRVLHRAGVQGWF